MGFSRKPYGRGWMFWKWLARNGVYLAAAPLLVALMAVTFPPRLTDGVKHLIDVAGLWEGRFTWPDQSRSYPISLSIRPDGGYVFDSVHRSTKGVVVLERGRVLLRREGLVRGVSLYRGLSSGKAVLLGRNGDFGTYLLNKVN
jgi:hypothetical protein